MSLTPRLRLALLIAMLSLGMLGCGQTGPLMPPAEPVTGEDEADDEDDER